MEGVGAEISQRDDVPTLATLGPRGRQMRVDRVGPVNESAAKASLHLQENGAATVMSVSKLQLPCSCCRANPRFQCPNGAVCSFALLEILETVSTIIWMHHRSQGCTVSAMAVFVLGPGPVPFLSPLLPETGLSSSPFGTLSLLPQNGASSTHLFASLQFLSLFWFLDGIEKRESSKRK